MIVPGSRRRDDEIAWMHRRALAVHGGVRAFAIDDEAQRRLRVPVARRHFAGQDQLQAAIERPRDARFTTQARILEHEHAPLRLLRRDQAAGLDDVRSNVVEAP